MKLRMILLVLLAGLLSCKQQKNNAEEALPQKVTAVKNDTVIVTNTDTVAAEKQNLIPVKDPLVGRHGLTIQWLTFDNNARGIAFINKQKDEWYSIKGEQQNAEGYLKMEGKIKMISPQQLLFDGVITYQISSINSGELCKKEGQQTFLSTKNRKYWRMQDMASCEGGTTDYIDLFF